MMDDQGAGGSSRGSGTNPEGRPIRESSLPPTLIPHLYDGPRHTSSQGIAPPIGSDWLNHHASRWHDRGRSLPSPSHLLLQTEPTFDYDRVTLSRSLDASPVNSISASDQDLPLPRLVLRRPLPPVDVDELPRSTADHSRGRYSFPPMSRSMSTSPLESNRHSHTDAPTYGLEPTSRTPQPPRPLSRPGGPSPEIRDVFSEDIGVLPQPRTPVRPLGDPYAELGRPPGFSHEQRRGRSEIRTNHTPRAPRIQIEPQARGRGRVEEFLRVMQRQVDPSSSQPIRERRQPTLYPIHAFEGKQRLQRTPPQPQRLQVHHQPQPKQPERFPQLLSGSSYHGSVGASSSTQVASTSQNQTVPGFSGELYSEDQPDLKSLHQRSPLAEHATIETQGAVPERKKAKRPPVAKEPRRPTTEDEGASPSTGTKPSIRKKPSNKVTVACDFCRGRKLRCDGEKPCSNCSGRGTQCMYQPGGPRRRGPGKAPKKTRVDSLRNRQQQRQQQQQQARRQPPDQSQMSISAASPVSSGPSPITTVPPTGIFGGGGPSTPGGEAPTRSRFPSSSPGVSTSEVETGSRQGKRRLSESSADAPERKRPRVGELKGEGRD